MIWLCRKGNKMMRKSTFGVEKSQGFTLIELMIVVVVVGILAAIAYPSYTRYVQRANETEVKGQIMEFASQLEAHRAKHFSYKGATVASLAPGLASNSNYQVDNPELSNNDQAYKITAQPKKNMEGWPVLIYRSGSGASWD